MSQGYHHQPYNRGPRGEGGQSYQRRDNYNQDRDFGRGPRGDSRDNRRDPRDGGRDYSQQEKPADTQVTVQKLSFAVVCASNQNRSMSAHYTLSKKYGMAVSSFGTGSSVKLPGKSRDAPIIYDFGTPYQDMFEDLKQQDEEL